MKRVRKKEFMPWQNYISDLTFMYQGLLLLFSAAIACASFYLSLSFALVFHDKLYETTIEGGSIISHVTSNLLWIAGAFCGLIVLLVLLEYPIELCVKKLLSREEHVGSVHPFSVKNRIITTALNSYLFSAMIFLMWLFSSVIFSLTIRNGMAEYLFIFVSIAILTYFAKKITAYPVYVLMSAHADAESKRRSAEMLVEDRGEGESAINVCKKKMLRSEYPKIYAAAERVASNFGYKISAIELTFEKKLAVEKDEDGGRRVNITLGAFLPAMLTEKQLEADICAEFVRMKNGSRDTLRRFHDLGRSYMFTRSKWNPLERIYDPILLLIGTEYNECLRMVALSTDKSIDKYAGAEGEDFTVSLYTAWLKKLLSAVMPFAYNKSFYRSLFASDKPIENYYTALAERYFEYFTENKEKALSVFSSLTEDDVDAVDTSLLKLNESAKQGKLDIVSRPSGDYAQEASRILKEFDGSFALLAAPRFKEMSERMYKRKIRRITEFENAIVSGEVRSTEEKVSVARDYLELMMPETAIDLLSDVEQSELDSNATLNLVLGEARLRLGDIGGLSMLTKASELNFRYTFKAMSCAERLLVAFGFAKEYAALRESFSTSIYKYLTASPGRAEDLCTVDELTGNFKLAPNVEACDQFSPEEKKSIAEDILEICGYDRFEWAAIVNVVKENKRIPTLIVRCSEIPPDGYTENYIDCVYVPYFDPLVGEISYYGDLREKPIFAKLVYILDIAPFETLEGAIISRKATIEAENLLKKELNSFLDGEDESEEEYAPFDEDDDTDRSDTSEPPHDDI